MIQTAGSGGDWEKELFVQSSTFAAAGIAGMVAAKGAALIIAATPVGWALILVSVVAVSATIAVSSYAGKKANEKADSNYDYLLGLFH